MSFDIFCRVVDNFGDIGVCWRLARQLAALPARPPVRLWVDDLAAFSRIEPQLDRHADAQAIQGVDIVHWIEPAPALQPHAVVIEAFACDPPPDFVERMRHTDSLWINLEYLSAESWVESCHALPSMQPNGLRKAFFFPGFTPATGGLLREPALLAQRDAWLARPALRYTLLRACGVPERQLAILEAGARQVMLFCYPDAPAAALLRALQAQRLPTVIMRPSGVCPRLEAGEHGNVYVQDVPFLDQAGFDHLLWCSDLNVVRGEDSLVRGLWAGKPLIWHIYPQDQGVHMDKLHALLDRSPLSPEARRLMHDWNAGIGAEFCTGLTAALEGAAWTRWQAESQRWTTELAAQPSLVESLMAFCTRQP
ncbi:elongation factor P maturation arginine rhamnosyltransferase EarP [Parapusillimonas sp. SGNA-6]|nr:elongation factor P maturation arginine rhamnosyltransferase EarP [Parapusillimonas sp. SGNA-6]